MLYYKKRGTAGIDGDYEHRRIAEAALGRLLRRREEVHHADLSRSNRRGNLVVCPDRNYHALLHRRTRALRASGNANAERCVFCNEWDVPGTNEMYVLKTRATAYHRACNAAKEHRRREASTPTRRPS